MTEKEVVAECLQYAFVSGLALRRQNTGAGRARGRFVRFGEVGQCDYTGVCTVVRDGVVTRGVHIEVEFKATGRTPRSEQRDYIQRIRAQGAVAFYADSLEMFTRKLREEGVDV
jgi:hypothetical protein